MRSNRRPWFVVSAVALLPACNPTSCLPVISLPDAGLPGLHRTEDALQDELVVQGVVSRAPATGGQVSPASGVDVRVGVDRNNDGTLAGSEFVAAQTDGSGRYRVEFMVTLGEHVAVSYTADGLAAAHRSLRAGPRANVRLNVTLQELGDLECTGPRCADQEGRVSVTGLADGMSGGARAFNPVSETSAFPGAFDDVQGNLLLSGSFAAVELRNASGDRVSTLTTPADLRMRVPPETWNIIKDLQPGTAGIDVPMYAYDEAAGTWRREGQGVLEDDQGVVIAEGRLADIRAGTFQGNVHARASVSHFSYWNVDWPVDTKGCITGIILDREGNPAQGATVYVSGVTYTGTSRGETVGADGRFCVEVMRSETAGEDVDQDGVTGETQRIRIRVAHRGVVYALGEFDVPVTAAVCGGACLDTGPLRISEDNEVIPSTCAINGRVVERGGAPVEGITVFAFDATLEPELWTSACLNDPVSCQFTTQSAADGTFTLRTPIQDGVTLFAQLMREQGALRQMRTATASFAGCPAQQVELVLDEGVDFYTLDVSVTGQVISWTPAVGATAVTVAGTNAARWAIQADPDLILPPVTYGVVPAGAMATTSSPDGGPLGPMTSGDTVMVVLGGSNDGGFTITGSGQFTLP